MTIARLLRELPGRLSDSRPGNWWHWHGFRGRLHQVEADIDRLAERVAELEKRQQERQP